jgi:hypothetical protein
MLEQLPMEFVTMAVSGLGGFMMKLKALDNERLKEERIHTIKAFETRMKASKESADAASSRIGSFGKLTRRIIAFGLLFAVVALPFVAPLLNVPTVIETSKESGSFLFGLLGGGTKTELQTVVGYLHSETVLVGFGHVVAFYFGQGAAKP